MPISYCPAGGESQNMTPGSLCPVHGVLLEPIMPQGMLSILGTQASLNGLLLARAGAANPFEAATHFLIKAGFDGGDIIDVAGTSGVVEGVAVFFIDSVRRR